jgi:hypothetical protein
MKAATIAPGGKTYGAASKLFWIKTNYSHFRCTNSNGPIPDKIHATIDTE